MGRRFGWTPGSKVEAFRSPFNSRTNPLPLKSVLRFSSYPESMLREADRAFRASVARHLQGATMGSLQRTAVALALAGAFALVVATVEHLSLDRADVAAQAAVPTAPPTTTEQRS